MATNVYSASRLLVDDVIVGRGQLGYGFSAALSASVALWSLARATKYNLTAAVTYTLTLPDVGTGSSQAQPGHSIIIRNNALSGGDIVLNNFGAVQVVVLSPGEAVQLIADTGETLDWYAVFNVPQPANVTNLQEAYDESGAVNPKILLSAFGAFSLQDHPTPLLEALSVKDNAGAYNYFTVGNGLTTGATPIVTMLSGTAAGMDASIAAGGVLTTTGGDANTMLFADPSAGISLVDVSNTHVTAFPTILKTAGDVQVGTTLTSPNEYTVWASSNATNAGAPTTIPLITLADNTTYRVRVEIIGRDADVTSQISCSHVINALVSNLVAAGVVQGQSDTAIDTVGYANPSVATLTAAAGVLSLDFTAQDNIVGATMPIRVVTTYSALTIV